MSDKHIGRNFYEDTWNTIPYGLWTRCTKLRTKMKELGWNPTKHDHQRMLILLAKHGKIQIKRNRKEKVIWAKRIL